MSKNILTIDYLRPFEITVNFAIKIATFNQMSILMNQ